MEEHKELLLACVKEMEAFEEERVYVAMEYPEKDEEAEEAENEEAMETKEKRLVFFTKERNKHKPSAFAEGIFFLFSCER